MYLSQRRVFVEVANDLSAQHPQVVDVFANGLPGKTGRRQMLNEWPETRNECFSRREVFLESHPRTGPIDEIAVLGKIRVRPEVERFMVGSCAAFFTMELITILNHCHRFRGFVYHKDRFDAGKQAIEIGVRPRAGSAAVCSGCHQPAPGYHHLPKRRFEFIPFWGILVFFVYRMRRVNCRDCGVVVEEVPCGDGKHQLTRAYMLFLARWARRLSWTETAQAFHTSWDKVCDAVDYVVAWGLEHRTLAPIRAIGVDEIQYAKGHKYLTLVYQIDADLTRLLWVGKERTVETFQGFFTMIGRDLILSAAFSRKRSPSRM